MKKESGEVHQFFIQMVGIILSFAILLYATYYLSTIITYNSINQIARKYILKMERQGYLDSSDISDIESELESSNISELRVDVNAEGESGKVKYGEDIRISIECKINQKKVNFSNFLFDSTDDEKLIKVVKASTAKW